ncbi:Na(+)-translocating NADH-quinone reductase subunit F [Desulfosarcina widdelii]|uniref:Na(+)-translocating NADH-quinone reductase subunit F n=1 Tax=Desulfosarcina widdelii TaxID=947919 RepID=A0A5K7Z9F1_9BACT|nr:NADH:ubiquinone reductase (Na(+)-transporting) subunit F [Desulfosarcina widdelii]BBO77325.1 Na(+)-translocating NADH-quinone reductase subunit F [Desulfosarcina widdelii]
MIYLIATAVFLSVIMILVGLLLLVEGKVVQKGTNHVVINNDEEKSIDAPSGKTLLSALSANGIFLPSGCGGGGSCGMCKCKVTEGSRGPLPTELAHLSRKERKEDIRLACQMKVKEDLKIRIPDDILSVKKYSATVVSNENVATFIKDLILELDDGEQLDFTAGAYIQIDIPEYEIPFELLRVRVAERYRPDWDRFNLWGLRGRNLAPVFRAYSLANPPAEPARLRFTVRIATPPPGTEGLPPGTGSTYIFSLKPGDKVTLSGPFGEFAIKESDREMCFVGGGAGMAPLRSQILDQLLRVKTDRKMTFWYGARSKLELFFEQEFKELAEKYPNFSYYAALSNPMPEDNWEGMTGYIHQQLHDHYLSDHEDPTEIEYYLCGPPMMVQAIEDMLDNLGVEPEMIAYDKFS